MNADMERYYARRADAERTRKTTEDIKTKCIEDLTREYKKATAERNTANASCAVVAEVLRKTQRQRDKLKAVAKEVLYILEKHGVDPALQERLQLAICDLPQAVAKRDAASKHYPKTQQAYNRAAQNRKRNGGHQ